MVKHVVKPLFLKKLRENILPKKSVFTRLFLQRLQGLSMLCFLARSALLLAGASPPVSCSQSTRATNCATSRNYIYLRDICYYNRFIVICQVFFEKIEAFFFYLLNFYLYFFFLSKAILAIFSQRLS